MVKCAVSVRYPLSSQASPGGLIKLMAFPVAVSHCDEAIRKDPNPIRAYLRKAQAYFALKEYTKCFGACVRRLRLWNTMKERQIIRR